jgi:hypothetical protein
MVASFSWFDRVSVFMDMKLLVCGIEKNGITVLNRALAAAQRKNFSWFPNNPSKEHLSLEAFKRLLQDPNNSWRKLVVYREPMERFLSAYHSKCLLRDDDGKKHCHDTFRLNASQISILNVARLLALYGHSNPHWAPQASFCGNTVGPMWESYTHHISFNNLSAIADVFEGWVPPKALSAVRSTLAPIHTAHGHVSRHITNAKGLIGEESPDVRRLLFDFYKDDYRVFLSESLYTLDRVCPSCVRVQ